MIGGIRLKICGITNAADALAAAGAGADFLGFILHPGSPRHITVEQYLSMAPDLPPIPRVAVLVEPAEPDLAAAIAAGFDFFQVHFRLGEKGVSPRGYAAQVGPERLWLAPRLSPGTNAPPVLLSIASTLLMDTYQAEGFGGSGRTGDWAKFRRHRQAHPGTTWILSGGLSPGNIAAALSASSADFIDVNSGVESAPGRKDHAKLKQLAVALGEVTTDGEVPRSDFQVPGNS